MYRQSKLRGCCVMALGAGMLLGCSIASAFWCCALGIGALVLGVLLMQQK